ncbi:hypothetical protein [Mucilaginibacter pedocola]|uniref:Uncharacterized protein n=1 Tax=Mucilaginibacter pedocola TaxID=1792845 RepID=A0A1S9PFT5_9SPHI|nr:hypothetical protein [Mucilaginibacter pedocola]OOQ59826.1 hypothetical protein BC343_06685 [Mucilaginibacter pedocola]
MSAPENFLNPSITSVIRIMNREQAESIENSIHQHGAFTFVVPNSSEWDEQRWLGLIWLNSERDDFSIGYIGVFKKQTNIAVGQVRLKSYDIFGMEPISAELLSGCFRHHVMDEHSWLRIGGYEHLGKWRGEELFEKVISLRPELKETISELYNRIHFPEIGQEDTGRISQIAIEKDAAGLSLDIFGVERSKIFDSWRMGTKGFGESFLSGLTAFTVYEDDVIAHDLHTFPGYEFVNKGDITGVVEFQNDEGEKLTVINANRKPLEKALGVDLIYFHRRYEAFVMVQYKIMDQRSASGEYYYNPNQESHFDELARLQRVKAAIDGENPGLGLKYYRFADCPLFFKLCRKINFKTTDHSLAPGMYIPLDQWELLLSDTSTEGPSGGVQIGTHTLKRRYMNKDTFVDLVQAGFVGTTANASKKIGAFLEDAIAKGRSVIYTIDEKTGARKRNTAGKGKGRRTRYRLVDDDEPF